MIPGPPHLGSLVAEPCIPLTWGPPELPNIRVVTGPLGLMAVGCRVELDTPKSRRLLVIQWDHLT